MKQIGGRKVHSDEGLRKLGYGSNSRLIMRCKSGKFDSESPCYHVEDNFSNFEDADLERIQLETKYNCKFVIQTGITGRRYYIIHGDNFIDYEDADLDRKQLETKYKCSFVIQERNSGQKYYIVPDPDDARHEEKFFKYTYVDDPDFNILKS